MNFSSSFLLILLVSHLFHHSAFAIRRLEDFGADKLRNTSMGLQDTTYVEDYHHVQRKQLHEVHSGPNPIGN
ncbi:hypothetical protein SLEP1_g42787 [Rubroshorea leprosula]|uniref:Uncharacterized protein n=1 Tax=Rubroshorea leprosula TaxID=152421 RepID=A0AAV5LBC6_9ROSI|nr:hypothetical protein SLEP1_g42787 [Rubroshorea leprosula]